MPAIISAGMTGTQFITALNSSNGLVNINDFYSDADAGDYSNAFTLLIAYCQANKRTAYFPKGEYLMSGTFVINTDFTIYAEDAVILSSMVTGVFLAFQGTIGNYTSITESIVSGHNYLKTTLTPSIDDLIKIRSDQPFGTVTGAESVGRGEMAVVRNVHLGYIFTHSPLMDDYSISNWDDEREEPPVSTLANVRVAIVSPIKVSIIGNLVIKNTTTTYATTAATCTGLSLTYCRDINVNVTIINFAQRLMNLNHCFGGKVDINGYGATRRSDQVGDGSPGYGVAICGTTQNIKINGLLYGCRHCIVHNGYEGVAWNNPISIIGYGARGNAIIDSHYPCGNMNVDDSILIGGEVVTIENSLDDGYNVTTGDKSSCQGIDFGARKNTITNTKFYNCSIGILPRDIFDVDSLHISNVEFYDCDTAITTKYFEVATINKLKEFVIDGAIMEGGTTFFVHNKDYINGMFLTLKNIKIRDAILFDVGTATLVNSNDVHLNISNIEASKTSGSLIKIKDEFRDLKISNIIARGYDVLLEVASTIGLNNLSLNNIDSDSDYLVKVTGDVDAERFNLIILNHIIAVTNALNLIHFVEAGQTLGNIISDIVYATGATAITNGTPGTEKEGVNIIFDN